MTEPIKQEIINNIFENGDKLITGPILQTVLIDMIDDVNVKDQEILSKTGSWDNAVTQIPNLATKEEVTNLSESIARDLENVVDVDLTGYATETWVESQGYLKEHQDISNLATKGELTEAENNLQGNITSLSESVARDLANVSVPEGVATEAWVQSQDYASKSYVNDAVASSSVDLTGYATETWVESQGYLKEHQDISNLATKSELTSVSESIQTDISNLATKGELNDTKNIIQGNITSLSESVARDLTGYATETWVQSQGYLTEHQDISGLATKAELTSVSESVQTDITNLSESVANSAVWKKGEGINSIVQVIADGTNLPTATGERAIATGKNTEASGENSHAEGSYTRAVEYNSHAEGMSTNASGMYSHAEGFSTKASGNNSHAEGEETVASGLSSHAEGIGTIAYNVAEHAQGQYNYTSSNQIFSVGAGEKDSNYQVTRRNAVSILAVPNADTQILTASFFVQNIGGYDGTNPEPGTNDLATVIGGLSSGGGSSSGGSSETLWKKGTGTNSIVQALTGDNETRTPTATNTGAVAIGFWTKASGQASHAEGSWTEASGICSHAEGYNTAASGLASHAEGNYTKANGESSHAEGSYTNASGQYSHAEGGFTVTSNQYEHAQGRYNYTSSNQIFSIGTGNNDSDRRNVVSVLEVSNNNSYTGSVFVQNIGGYDGTNPLPGTNDLATVLNNTETWTFTLEDGSTVTKTIIMR